MPALLMFLATSVLPFIPSIMRGLASYVAVAVGFSLVSYVGAGAAIDKFRDYIQNNIDGLPTSILALVNLSGLPESINAILTCIVFSMTLSGLMKSQGYKPSWRKPS